MVGKLKKEGKKEGTARKLPIKKILLLENSIPSSWCEGNAGKQALSF